jgi:lipopolysaccharide/colanic/teichoic acid biosynthesis glycosyltransferase
MDIIGALLGFVILSPLLLLIAAAIKITSSGPVLFKQERIGYLEQPFMLWKFRTMKMHSDISIHKQYLEKLINSNNPMTKLDVSHDPRVTPLGKILRMFCLDELPQLVNVLRGDMSLVGPRPDPFYAIEYYLSWQKKRFCVLPGITGLWQIRGKNNKTFEEMVHLDLIYTRKMSLWFDIKILLLTIPAIIEQIHSTQKSNIT